MDRAEQHVASFLKHRGFADVIHEPDGNIPPDFLVDGRIAIEVRRLNQQESTSGSPRGLTDTAIPLEQSFRKLLDEFGPPRNGVSWWVFYSFSRPLEPWRTLAPRIRAWLTTLQQDSPEGSPQQAFGAFAVRAVRITQQKAKAFINGMIVDEQSGGLVTELVLDSLRVCVPQKTKKVEPYRAKYPEWWLVLVDQVGWHLEEPERLTIRRDAPSAPGWTKVILVDPLDASKSFDIV